MEEGKHSPTPSPLVCLRAALYALRTGNIGAGAVLPCPIAIHNIQEIQGAVTRCGLGVRAHIRAPGVVLKTD